MASSARIDLPPLLGESPAFLELLEEVSRLAPVDRPVLIVGERGTGKELVAARLHYLSRRWERDFIKLNCATLAESLLESELFGHEAGAFTGAIRRRAGRFELADRGTLFLDEIANASLAVQEKTLRAIEYGEFERVGGTETVQVDVRLIGATNADLPGLAAEGHFRDDLLDRLSFDVITVPPLRARPKDIPLLAQHYGRAMASELGWDAFPGLSHGALKKMRDHSWPGNVRELRNVVERAVSRADNRELPIDEVVFDPFSSPFRLGKANSPPATKSAASEPASHEVSARTPIDYRASVAGFERRLLEEAMAAQRHNQRAAASHLGLGYHQLRNALRKHGLIGKRND